MITPYLSLARIDNWSKNLVVLIGVFLACALSGATLALAPVVLALFAMCLGSSANYVLNESLDAKTDAYHPIKKQRASVKYALNKTIVAALYFGCFLGALCLAHLINQPIFLVVCFYLFCGWIYNIPPIRFKDKAYLDVILESINYPLRVLVGWYALMPDIAPPGSIVIVAWSAGAFTMSLKRLAELQLFHDHEAAARYRRSYAQYTVHSLIISGFVYALATIFGLTILLLKYKIELLLIVPLLIGLLAWYFLMGLREKLFIIYPERLLGEKFFILLCVAIIVLGGMALQMHIPAMQILTQPVPLTASAP